MAGRLTLAAALLLAIGMPAGAAPFVQAIRVDHAAFAACAYAVLARAYPARLRREDVRGADTVRIILEETGFGLPASSPVLAMSVRKVGRGAEVEIQSAPTMRGEDFYAARTWREIQGCLPPGP